MWAYIISYLGSRQQPEARQQRLHHHNQQIAWWRQQYPTMHFQILAQDYDEHEYNISDGVHYIKTGAMPPAAGRNLLLKHFYDVNPDEWCVFMDNDAILKHHDDWEHTHVPVCDIIERYPHNWHVNGEHIHVFQPHNPGRPGDGAFNQRYSNQGDFAKNPVDWQNEFCFDRSLFYLKGTLFWLKKPPQPVWFDEDFYVFADGELVPDEDNDFALSMTRHTGMSTYILRNVMLYEYPQASTWVKQDGDRKHKKTASNHHMAKKHHLPMDTGKWSRSWRKQYGISAAQIRATIHSDVSKNPLDEWFN